MRNFHLAILAVALVAACIFYTQYARAMNIATPRDSFLHSFQEARGQPLHSIWWYIAGIVSGTNATSIITTGGPAICDAHPFEQHEKTEEVILRWLLVHDLIDNPDIILEVVVPLAFREAYPCNSIKA